MPREESVVPALVELADMVHGECGVVDVLAMLVERSVHLLDVTSAAVVFTAPEGDLRSMAATDEGVHRLSLLEVQCRQGPSVDVARSGVAMVNRDLDTMGGQWPHFSRAAARADFRWVSALPMGMPGQVIGSIVLLREGDIGLNDADVVLAGALTDMATKTILWHRALGEVELMNWRLTQALEERIVIEQAKGVLSARRRISLSDAFSLMRRYADRRNLELHDVAHGVVRGSVDPPVHAPKKAPEAPPPWDGGTTPSPGYAGDPRRAQTGRD
jgi:hypothetical protein